MTTKNELIAECKAENPKMVSVINGEEIELTAAEYDKACNDWAEMRLQQIAKEEADAAEQAVKEAAQAKLIALGLTEADLIAMGILAKPEAEQLAQLGGN
jgi:hypothetical protein